MAVSRGEQSRAKATEEGGRDLADALVYPSVAQSAAMAVQDAEDHLRNVMTLSEAASAVAMALIAAGDEVTGGKLLDAATAMVDKAATQFAAVGEAAERMLKSWPGAETD